MHSIHTTAVEAKGSALRRRCAASLLMMAAGTASAQVTPGDVALVGWMDYGAPDTFALATLAPIPAGTRLYFTDNGWTGTQFNGAALADGNGAEDVMGLFVSSDLPAGMIIASNISGPGYTWQTGKIGTTQAMFNTLTLGTSGDQIYIFASEETANPLYRADTQTHIFLLDDTGTFENAKSFISGNVPPGLTVGQTAITFQQSDTNQDFMAFNTAALSAGTKQQWLEAIGKAENWTFARDGVLPTGSISVLSGSGGPRNLTFAKGIDWNAADAWLDGSNPAAWNNDAPDNALFMGHTGVVIQVMAPVSVGSMQFEGFGEAIIGEKITIRGGIIANAPAGLANAVNLAGDQTWMVGPQQQVMLNGPLGGKGFLTKTGEGALVLSGDTSGLDGGIILSAGTIRADSLRFESLVIGAGNVQITSSEVSRLNRLEFSSAQLDQPVPTVQDGQLDLGAGTLVLSPSSADRQRTYEDLVKLIRSGRDGGQTKWTGNGITSSAAAANPDLGVIVMVNEGRDGAPIFSKIDDTPVTDDDIIVKRSWNGDLNLDGRVNADDYFYIDQGFLQKPTGPTYHDGDFNYDGKINADDYFLIDQAFLNQKGVVLASTMALVPEPGHLVLLSIGAITLLSRRRPNHGAAAAGTTR